jgi:hypothetical protein
MRDLHVACLSLILGATVATPSTFSAGQERPPIPGVTGTIALEGTVDKTSAGANTIIVKSADGFRHLFHLTKRTAVHGAKEGDAALHHVNEGSHVIIHYAADGGEDTAEEIDRIGEDGLRELRGIVTSVRAVRQLTVRLDDGSMQAFVMTERAARHSARHVDAGARVIVYYTDEGAQKIAHYVSTVRRD